MPGARRPRSPPAGDSLTQRVVRLVPCRGWIEDVRGEPGAEETLCHLGAAGRWEDPSPQEPALAPFPAATSAKGLRTRGLALPSAWLCPTCSGSSGTVTVILFFRDPDGASLTGPPHGEGSNPQPGREAGAGGWEGPLPRRYRTCPRALAASRAQERDFIRKRAKRLGSSEPGLARGGGADRKKVY